MCWKPSLPFRRWILHHRENTVNMASGPHEGTCAPVYSLYVCGQLQIYTKGCWCFFFKGTEYNMQVSQLYSLCSSYDHWSLKKGGAVGKRLHCQQLNSQKSIQRSATSNNTLVLMISCLRYPGFINCLWIYFLLPVVIFSSEQVENSNIKSMLPVDFIKRGCPVTAMPFCTQTPHGDQGRGAWWGRVFRLCNKHWLRIQFKTQAIRVAARNLKEGWFVFFWPFPD